MTKRDKLNKLLAKHEIENFHLTDEILFLFGVIKSVCHQKTPCYFHKTASNKSCKSCKLWRPKTVL